MISACILNYNENLDSKCYVRPYVSVMAGTLVKQEVIFDKDRNNIGIPIIAGVFVVFGLFAFILGKVKAKKESEVW